MTFKNTLEFVILFGVSIGLFISTSLFFIKKKNNNANKILAFIVFLAVVMLVGRLYLTNYNKSLVIFKASTFVDATIFLFGPLVLSFLKTLLFKSDSKKSFNLLQLAPLFLYTFYIVWVISLNDKYFSDALNRNSFSVFFFLIELLGILTNCFFIIKSYLIIQKHKTLISSQLSFNQNIIQFAIVFISTYAFAIFTWIVGFVSYYIIGNYSSYLNYDMVWVAIPIFIYLIGFYVLTQPEIFKLNTKLEAKKSVQYRLPKEKIEKLKIEINKLLKEEKIYHQNNLALSDFAKELNISNNDLSWLINNGYKTNFYELINSYRVAEFIERIKKGDYQKHTIAAVSIDVGFNSKSTFYKAFKLITKTTPIQYIKKLESES